jgi:NitT/TauT family transport system substrate-binding protein
MRSRGVPIVHVAQIVRRSSLLLLARSASGIRAPADLNGKKVGVWEGDFLLQPQIFFDENDLDVRAIPIGSTVNLFLRGGTDATVAMWYNEYHTILNAGVEPGELVTFFFRDYGLDFPEDGIYCREDTARERPELVERFVDASLEGWEYAFAHPAEAVDLVLAKMENAKLPTSRVHQDWMLARMRDLMLADGAARPTGELSDADYARVAAALRQRHWIDRVPGFDEFAPPRFRRPETSHR